jgi:acetoin utilization protein AcuB
VVPLALPRNCAAIARVRDANPAPGGVRRNRRTGPVSAPSGIRCGHVLAYAWRMTDISIERFMTKSPHTIGIEQTLAAAHRAMSEHGVRHLPVLHAGKLVGLVSQRDLTFIDSLKGVEPTETRVSEAMATDVYTASARDGVKSVAAHMAQHKYGSAVIVDAGQVVGVFTTIDALRALVGILDAGQAATE